MPEEVIQAQDLPANLRSLYDKSVAAVKMQNASYAVPLLLAVLKEAPSFLEGRRILRGAAAAAGSKKGGLSSGLAMMKLQPKVKKDPAGALMELEEFLATDPYNPQANQLMFDAANALGLNETAAFALEMVMRGHPNDVKNMQKLAAFYLAHDDAERAINVFQNIIKADPSNGEARKGLTNANAKMSMQKQKWEGGEGGDFKKLLADQGKVKQMEDLARVGATKEQMQEQLAILGAQYDANPNDVNVSRQIGDIYERLDDFPSALTYYQWAYQLSNGDSSIETKMHKMRDKMDEHEIAVLNKEIEGDPDGPESEEKRARLQELHAARIQKLIDTAKERVERNPTDPQLRFELGSHLFAGGFPTEAIPELQRAKGNPAIRTKAMLALSRCYDAKNMSDLAQRQLQEAAGELPTMDALKKEVVYFLGSVLDRMGKKEEALDAFKQIYEIDYGYMDVAARVEGSY